MRKVWPILATLMIVALGCSDAARDRLMHFFFEIPEESRENGATSEAEQAPPAGEDAAPEGLTVPESAFVSIHPPYRIRDCKACHAVEQNMRVRDDLTTACETCHARFFGDEVAHEPVEDGDCMLCHYPHRSELPHLLRAAVPGLCTDCHDSDDLSEEAHSGVDGNKCTGCHSPHFGADHLLLPGARE